MKINVAYGADDKFTRHTYVSIFSILKNMKKDDVLCCYFLTRTPNKNTSIIKKLEKRFSNFKLNIVPVNKIRLDKMLTSKELAHINSSTYYRFWIDLIGGIEKIIYLDSDIIVNSDISELFQEDLNSKTVWVCSDMPKDYIKSNIDEIWLNKNKYFNAGVLVININKRKKQKISQKCFNLLSKRVYKFNDQDVLNIVLQDDVKYLPWNYNVQSWYFQWYLWDFTYLGFENEYYQDAINNPKIIHYTGDKKPRNLFCNHPFCYKYYITFLKSIPIFSIRGGVKRLKESVVILCTILNHIRKIFLEKINKKHKLFTLEHYVD